MRVVAFSFIEENSMWWFILIPILWVAITKVIWHKNISWQEVGIHLGSVLPATVLIFAVGYHSSIGDTLLIHGQVTQKVRNNDSHQESYSCNCTTRCSGGKTNTCSTTCQTCWRTVYTVDWYLKSTIGNIQIDYERSYYRSVWNTPDPKQYLEAYVGEPCSKSEYFKNYVKGSPSSLFNTGKYVTKPSLPVPNYPNIHNIYKVNNLINVGTSIKTDVLEEKLSHKLKVLGAKKQANVILILANTQDANYKYAVEKAWLGGKKNDIVVIVGTTDSKNVLWADGFTFGLSQGNHLMLTQMLDNLRGKSLESTDIVEVIASSIESGFKRKQMEDFKYLAREIEPSTSLLIFVFILQLISNIGITIWSIRNDN